MSKERLEKELNWWNDTDRAFALFVRTFEDSGEKIHRGSSYEYEQEEACKKLGIDYSHSRFEVMQKYLENWKNGERLNLGIRI